MKRSTARQARQAQKAAIRAGVKATRTLSARTQRQKAYHQKVEEGHTLKDPIISLARFAALIGVGTGTVHVWRCTGKYGIPMGHRLGSGRIVYRLSEAEAFANRLYGKSTAAQPEPDAAA